MCIFVDKNKKQDTYKWVGNHFRQSISCLWMVKEDDEVCLLISVQDLLFIQDEEERLVSCLQGFTRDWLQTFLQYVQAF